MELIKPAVIKVTHTIGPKRIKPVSKALTLCRNRFTEEFAWASDLYLTVLNGTFSTLRPKEGPSMCFKIRKQLTSYIVELRSSPSDMPIPPNQPLGLSAGSFFWSSPLTAQVSVHELRCAVFSGISAWTSSRSVPAPPLHSALGLIPCCWTKGTWSGKFFSPWWRYTWTDFALMMSNTAWFFSGNAWSQWGEVNTAFQRWKIVTDNSALFPPGTMGCYVKSDGVQAATERIQSHSDPCHRW